MIKKEISLFCKGVGPEVPGIASSYPKKRKEQWIKECQDHYDRLIAAHPELSRFVGGVLIVGIVVGGYYGFNNIELS